MTEPRNTAFLPLPIALKRQWTLVVCLKAIRGGGLSQVRQPQLESSIASIKCSLCCIIALYAAYDEDPTDSSTQMFRAIDDNVDALSSENKPADTKRLKGF